MKYETDVKGRVPLSPDKQVGHEIRKSKERDAEYE